MWLSLQRARRVSEAGFFFSSPQVSHQSASLCFACHASQKTKLFSFLVNVRFRAVGSAPALRRPVAQVSPTSSFVTVVKYLRRVLRLQEHEGVFCYVNSVFAPGLDEGVGNLWRVSPLLLIFPLTCDGLARDESNTDHRSRCSASRLMTSLWWRIRSRRRLVEGARVVRWIPWFKLFYSKPDQSRYIKSTPYACYAKEQRRPLRGSDRVYRTAAAKAHRAAHYNSTTSPLCYSILTKTCQLPPRSQQSISQTRRAPPWPWDTCARAPGRPST